MCCVLMSYSCTNRWYYMRLWEVGAVGVGGCNCIAYWHTNQGQRLMTLHFNYHPRLCLGNNQSAGSSVFHLGWCGLVWKWTHQSVCYASPDSHSPNFPQSPISLPVTVYLPSPWPCVGDILSGREHSWRYPPLYAEWLGQGHSQWQWKLLYDLLQLCGGKTTKTRHLQSLTEFTIKDRYTLMLRDLIHSAVDGKWKALWGSSGEYTGMNIVFAQYT